MYDVIIGFNEAIERTCLYTSLYITGSFQISNF